MCKAEKINKLMKDLNTLVTDGISPDGECLFDPTDAEIALKFAYSEIQASIERNREQKH